jgi:hypothetical protein
MRYWLPLPQSGGLVSNLNAKILIVHPMQGFKDHYQKQNSMGEG